MIQECSTFSRQFNMDDCPTLNEPDTKKSCYKPLRTAQRNRVANYQSNSDIERKIEKGLMEYEIKIYNPSQKFQTASAENRYISAHKKLLSVRQQIEANPNKEKDYIKILAGKHTQASDIKLKEENVTHFKQFLQTISTVDVKRPFKEVLFDAMALEYNPSYVKANNSPYHGYSKQPSTKKIASKKVIRSSTAPPRDIPALGNHVGNTKKCLSKYIKEHKKYKSGEYTTPSINMDTLVKLRAISSNASSNRIQSAYMPLEEISVLKRNKLVLENVMLKRADNIIFSQRNINEMKQLPNSENWRIRKAYAEQLSKNK